MAPPCHVGRTYLRRPPLSPHGDATDRDAQEDASERSASDFDDSIHILEI